MGEPVSGKRAGEQGGGEEGEMSEEREQVNKASVILQHKNQYHSY